jgi:superfamily II DNA or RNA helicase
MLTRRGLLIPRNDDFKNIYKNELTVRPDVNTEYGIRPPSFKLYRATKDNVYVPRYYGTVHRQIDLVQNKVEPPSHANIEFGGRLRDSTKQNAALSSIVAQLDKVGGGILSLPCGYGKTTVALAVAAHYKVRTMVVVHKEFLANQWRQRIQEFCPGATIGIVQQNKCEVECDFVIAMLQSLSMKEYEPKSFDSVGMVIVDEAHHVCARVFSQALFTMCPKYTLGLTATPIRKDGLTNVLYWFLGPEAFTVEREMRGQTTVECNVWDCPLYKTPPPVTRFGKVSLVQMITDLVEMKARNDFLEKIIRNHAGGSRRILILSDRRLHCEELARRFEDLGSGLYMGGMKEKDLEESTKKKIIIGTFSQAHEGLDIPVLDTILLATPKSDIKQAVGRILRETTGKKNSPLVIDVKDKWGMLPSMYYKRRKIYKESGFDLSDKEPVSTVQKTILNSYAFLED